MYSQGQEPWSEKPTVCQERCWDFGLLDPQEAGGKGHWEVGVADMQSHIIDPYSK